MARKIEEQKVLSTMKKLGSRKAGVTASELAETLGVSKSYAYHLLENRAKLTNAKRAAPGPHGGRPATIYSFAG